jgi:hypothetical protein
MKQSGVLLEQWVSLPFCGSTWAVHHPLLNNANGHAPNPWLKSNPKLS